MDTKVMLASLGEFEKDLYAIDGPQQTWNLKKSLRRRVQTMLQQVTSAKNFDLAQLEESKQNLWIPALPYEVNVGNEVHVVSDCFRLFGFAR